ncbi:MAG: hypothetical protein ACOYZ7_06155 [Chloroflexota bacterium]
MFLYYGFIHLRLEKAFNIGSVEQASAAFPWAVGALALMAVAGARRCAGDVVKKILTSR